MKTSEFFKPEDRPHNVAVISIGAPWNEEEDHWFKTTNDRVLNIDFDDVSPEFWWKHDMYDDAMNDDDQSKYTSITHIGENRIRVIGEVTITIPKQYLSTLNVTKKKQFILIDFSINKDKSVILLKKAQ